MSHKSETEKRGEIEPLHQWLREQCASFHAHVRSSHFETPEEALRCSQDFSDGLWEQLSPSSKVTMSIQGDAELIAEFHILPGSKKLQICFKPYYADSATWGIVLADAARHLARCYGQLDQRGENEVLNEIVQLFSKELKKPTSSLTGGLVS